MIPTRLSHWVRHFLPWARRETVLQALATELRGTAHAADLVEPKGQGRQRWLNRWKAPLNAFELAFP